MPTATDIKYCHRIKWIGGIAKRGQHGNSICLHSKVYYRQRTSDSFINSQLRLGIGIQFADAQIGTRVNFLDVSLYLDSEGQIQCFLFRKKTDARQYLNTASLHPPQVFESVAFSQMLRVIKRNSSDETCVIKDLEELKTDFSKSGH